MNPKQILHRAAHAQLARDVFKVVTRIELTDLLAGRLNAAQAADVRRRLATAPKAAARVAKMEADIARSLQPEEAAAMQARLDATIAAARRNTPAKNIIPVDFFYDLSLVNFAALDEMLSRGTGTYRGSHASGALAAHGVHRPAEDAKLVTVFTVTDKVTQTKTVKVEVWSEGEGSVLVFAAGDPKMVGVGAKVLFEFGTVLGEVTLADVWGATTAKKKLNVPCDQLLRATPRFNLIEH